MIRFIHMMQPSIKKVILWGLALFGTLSIISIAAIFLLLIIYKPLGVKVQNIPSAIIKSQTGAIVSTYDHPLLTVEQESTLETLGIDTTTLPTELTEQQLLCFSEKLGPARVAEITNGSPVTPNDYLKAKNCLN